MLSIDALMLHVVASWQYFAKSWLPPLLLSPWRYLVHRPDKIEEFYAEVP